MDNTAARKHAPGMQIVCLAPCVCKTPMGATPVPVPYMIVGDLKNAMRTVESVLFAGEEAFTMNSRITTVTGNEAGTAGGVASGVNLGWCRPQTNKPSVFLNGYELIQHDCVFEMNCAGPEGSLNTLGKLIYPEEA
jgi:hypothetical protein